MPRAHRRRSWPWAPSGPRIIWGFQSALLTFCPSGVAGTMAANQSGLQMDTLRNLLLAWVLTLPVCVVLGAGLFAFGLNLLLRFGIR
jgi:PiT family inorganic phosphate transporter